MSQSTLEKRTVITSSATSSSIGGGGSVAVNDGGDDFYYKSGIHPRNSSVEHHSSLGGVIGSGGGGGYRRTVEITSGMMPSGYGTVSHTGVTNVKTTREKEKKDMQHLNERFANYIEKVRFLEAQNRKLISELEQLKSNWGKETSAIKKMYETELAEARRMIEETNQEKNKLDVKMQTMQDQLNSALKQQSLLEHNDSLIGYSSQKSLSSLLEGENLHIAYSKKKNQLTNNPNKLTNFMFNGSSNGKEMTSAAYNTI